MSQLLQDRIRAALVKGSRLPDCRAILADAEAALVDATAKKAAAEERRLDPELSAEQAAEAQLDAEEWRLEELRLGRAVDRLRATIAAKEAKATADEQRKRHDQIKHRRDTLAEELRERVPGLLAELVGLLQRIEASDAELAGTGLESAEAVARGVPGNFYRGPVGIARLTKLKLPAFNGSGLVWPIDRHSAGVAMRMEAEQRQILAARAERDPAAVAAKLEAEDRAHALYYVQQAYYCGTTVFGIEHRGGHTGIGMIEPEYGPPILEMNEDQVRAARAKRMKVEPLPAELRRYRVSGSRSYMGSAPTIETATGRAAIGGPNVPCVMTADQAEKARQAGFQVEPLPNAEPAKAAA